MHFTEDGIQMASKHRKRCSAPQKNQSKWTQGDTISHVSDWQILKGVGAECPWVLSSLLRKCKLVHQCWGEVHQFLSRFYTYVSFDPVHSAFENLFYRNTGKSEQIYIYRKFSAILLVITKDWKYMCISRQWRKSKYAHTIEWIKNERALSTHANVERCPHLVFYCEKK